MNFLIMNKGDIDLESLFFKLNKRFQKASVINIGIQLVIFILLTSFIRLTVLKNYMG